MQSTTIIDTGAGSPPRADRRPTPTTETRPPSDRREQAATTTSEPAGDALRGRTALVTGGGRGIGAAITEALAAQGADIVLTYRDDLAAANRVAERCRADHGVRVTCLPFDLAAPDDARDLCDSLTASSATIDVLVVNAAAPYPKVGLGDLEPGDLTTKLVRDVGALHVLVRGLVPAMRRREFGRVVVIGSLHALGPFAPGMTANGVTKAAMAAYVDYAVEEFSGHGVTINTVEPGYITTDASTYLPPSVLAALDAFVPGGRLGTPDDVAAIAALVARPSAEYLNGARLPVSGGLNSPVALRRMTSPDRGGR